MKIVVLVAFGCCIVFGLLSLLCGSFAWRRDVARVETHAAH